MSTAQKESVYYEEVGHKGVVGDGCKVDLEGVLVGIRRTKVQEQIKKDENGGGDIKRRVEERGED